MASMVYEPPALVVLGTVIDLTECNDYFTSVTGLNDSFGAVGCS